jgi:DNA-binding NtrC family response regulator
MGLAEQLLRQIDNPGLGETERAWLRCQVAKELTERGNPEAARAAMEPVWRGIGERPLLDHLDRAVAAEVLLRAGVLSSLIGSLRQIEGAQEIAKDLISESVRNFEELKEEEKVAEAQSALAVCYWREGAFDEARVLLREVIDRCSDKYVEQRARALLNSTMVEISTMHFDEALRLMTMAAPLFDKINNHVLKGNFHNQLALVLRKLGTLERRPDYTDRAIVEYAAASYHYERAGNERYRASVENNLAFLLFTIGNFPEAHKHLDRAKRLFMSLKDSGSIAQVNDTRAHVFLAEGRVAEAEKAVRSAVRTLEKGDESPRLAEALITHGMTLARLARYQEARSALGRALRVAEQAGDKESAGLAAITAIEELDERLKLDEMQALYDSADGLLVNSQNAEMLNRLRACARRLILAEPAPGGEFSAPDFIYAAEETGDLLRLAHRVAGTDETVLLTGGTGTGKELLARLIHSWSGRAGRFVTVNCGALENALIESRLFGHMKGSFRDALQEHAGAICEAEGGTLFLENVAELTYGHQAKLLRFIERGEILPLGASVPGRVDVRVVASSSRDLKELVKRGLFRADLFYRLCTFHLIIPPLRERPTDIPALATHFIKEVTGSSGKSVTFEPEAIEAMCHLPLRGNAQELRALIEATVMSAKDETVISRSAVETVAARGTDVAPLSDPWQGCSLKEEVLGFESSIVKLALETARGSVTHAARLLGITHQRLCAMLQGRHKNLLLARKATRPRKRTIIRRLEH